MTQRRRASEVIPAGANRGALRKRCDIDGPIRTLTEVGKMTGLSKERVRQIENGALAKLRAALVLSGYDDGCEHE